MKILIVNTSELSGGAALAANRLKDALNKQGEKAMMLVRDKQSDDPTVVGIGGGLGSSLRFLWERVRILLSLRFNRSHLFDLDTGYCGFDITRLKEFRDADVVHLHWVNQGMLSLSGLRRILESGKPVVWTMHDAWPSTAICHLTLGCHRYQSGCQRCKYLPGGGSTNDLSAAIWKRKQSIFKGKSLTFVACSRWLAAEAGRSKLLKGQHITAIPNPIDTHLFRPGDKDEARKRLGLPADQRLILFAAQRATNSYKGMDYLQAACNKLTAAHPELAADTAVVVMGGHAEEITAGMGLEAYPLGYVSDRQKLCDAYNAADVFVLPSLSENLPNTIMEAMACGVACVGFNVGGIPEMIDHRRTGYVAAYKSSEDLAAGLHWVLCEADSDALGKAARAKAVRQYSEQTVAMSYIDVYEQALAMKHYKL